MIKSLIHFLQQRTNKSRVIIQPHNFPDQDAIASAFGLLQILSAYQIHSHIVFLGDIQRWSLIKMMNKLNIPFHKSNEFPILATDLIIHTDSAAGHNNVAKLGGQSLAVIDHHDIPLPENIPFVDLRPDYGSTCTIISEYFQTLGISPDMEVATALKIGIHIDTALLTRHISQVDLSAIEWLYKFANNALVNHIIRNNLFISDLNYFEHLIKNIRIRKDVAFCFFPNGCPKNLLGILGDFTLSLEEIQVVILVARNDTRLDLSIRSEDSTRSANAIVHTLVANRGDGGGHQELAGGIIYSAQDDDETVLYEMSTRFILPM